MEHSGILTVQALCVFSWYLKKSGNIDPLKYNQLKLLIFVAAILNISLLSLIFILLGIPIDRAPTSK